MRVLVVGDVSAVRRDLRIHLHGAGVRDIVETSDGQAALEHLREGGFDLLITDSSLPRLGGVELVRAVRTDESLATLPVLMVTADAHRARIVEAARAGVNGYVLKPFNARTLIDQLERLRFPCGVV